MSDSGRHTRLRERLDALQEQSRKGGGDERIARQHGEGKLTARERLDRLLDAGSFVELDAFVTHRSSEFGMASRRVPGDGVITGSGTVDGRRVFVFAQDFTVFGGSVSAAHAQKICKVMDVAVRVGAPLVGLYDSGGARIQEGVDALAAYADIFLRNTLASGVVPQLALILGPCAGGAVFSPAISDFVLMARPAGSLFLNSPDAIKAATGEDVSRQQLGGADAHATLSGVAHFALDTEAAALACARELLSFLPSSSRERAPRLSSTDDARRQEPGLQALVPESMSQAFDVRDVIRAVVDNRRFFEVHEGFARNMVVGFARLDGRVVGVVANNSLVQGGALDGNAAVKASRFVRFLDAFQVPVVTLVDVPGFVPAVAQEWGGLIRHGARLLYAFAEATVPKVTVIIRRAWGVAYDVMASKHLRGDINLAWPSAEVAVVAPESAVEVLYRKELEDSPGRREELVEAYRAEHASAFRAAELGFIDSVIAPEATRQHLIASLELLDGKHQPGPARRHGNPPL